MGKEKIKRKSTFLEGKPLSRQTKSVLHVFEEKNEINKKSNVAARRPFTRIRQ